MLKIDCSGEEWQKLLRLKIVHTIICKELWPWDPSKLPNQDRMLLGISPTAMFIRNLDPCSIKDFELNLINPNCPLIWWTTSRATESLSAIGVQHNSTQNRQKGFVATNGPR